MTGELYRIAIKIGINYVPLRGGSTRDDTI